MIHRLIVMLFQRNKYPATAAGKTYLPRNRAKLNKQLGGATRVNVHTRVYGRDANVTLDFDVVHGCLGDEPPLEGPRQFSLAKTGTTPALPYDSTSMPTLPDDGTFSVAPQMGLADIQAKCAGATGSIEFESWATLEFED